MVLSTNIDNSGNAAPIGAEIKFLTIIISMLISIVTMCLIYQFQCSNDSHQSRMKLVKSCNWSIGGTIVLLISNSIILCTDPTN